MQYGLTCPDCGYPEAVGDTVEADAIGEVLMECPKCGHTFWEPMHELEQYGTMVERRKSSDGS